MTNLQKGLIGGAAALFVIFVGAYLFMTEEGFVYRISEGQIRSKMSEKLPLTKAYLYVFEVTLDNPRVELIEGTDRVKAGIDVGLNLLIGGQDEPLGGTVDASSGIRYVPETGQFFLTDPHVEDLEIDGVPAAYAIQLNSVLTTALTEYYQSRPIYSIEGKETKDVLARLLLKDVTVENKKLVIRLGL